MCTRWRLGTARALGDLRGSHLRPAEQRAAFRHPWGVPQPLERRPRSRSRPPTTAEPIRARTLDHDAQFWTTTLHFGPRRFGLDHDAGTGDAIPSLKTVLESPARGRHTKVRAGLERKFNFLSKP